jgi:hypothetical protein
MQEAGRALGAGGASPGLPLFYSAPQIITPQRHAGKSIAPDLGFGFARGTNAVSVLDGEFASVVRCYPIVFAATMPTPMAVLGLELSVNLFVDGTGAWAPGWYTPAYIRRYPYLFIERAEEPRFVLAVDEAPGVIEASGSRPLFVGSEPSAELKAAAQFCKEFQGQYERTVDFVRALDAAALLVDRRADIEMTDGRRFVINGFRVIDEERFNALPDETIVAWHRKGWLGLIHAHFHSSGNWKALIDRAARG